MRKLVLLSVLSLCSCQTWGPTWSEVAGQRWNVPSTEFSVAPTSVQSIDGNSAFPNGPTQYIKIAPGPHTIVLAAAPLSSGWIGGTALETMRLDIAPCKRYYINGKYDNRLSATWKPFVDYEETIAGCMVTASK